MQKTNKQLFFILIIFLFPLIASWILFHYHTHFPLKTNNHGTFIHTPVNITYLYSGPKKWRILYVTGKTCASDCQDIHHELQQVQKALGKNSDRVTILLIPDNNLAISHKIYLADPLGNVFMYYPENTDPMNILKDLQHVLEVSQIG